LWATLAPMVIADLTNLPSQAAVAQHKNWWLAYFSNFFVLLTSQTELAMNFLVLLTSHRDGISLG